MHQSPWFGLVMLHDTERPILSQIVPPECFYKGMYGKREPCFSKRILCVLPQNLLRLPPSSCINDAPVYRRIIHVKAVAPIVPFAPYGISGCDAYFVRVRTETSERGHRVPNGIHTPVSVLANMSDSGTSRKRRQRPTFNCAGQLIGAIWLRIRMPADKIEM